MANSHLGFFDDIPADVAKNAADLEYHSNVMSTGLDPSEDIPQTGNN
jgi:hypothetical protein